MIMQRPTTLTTNEYHSERDPLEDHPLFTPDLEYFTPPTAPALHNSNAYCSRTLTPDNLIRESVLPSFRSFQSVDASTTTENQLGPFLLLSNVPTQELSPLQLARRAPNAYSSSFELIENNLEIINHRSNSFMLSIYRQLLHDLSIKWNLSIPLLDYNLARLRQCAKKCLEQLQQQQRQEQLQLIPRLITTATFSIEELPLALEFYLQIDVDLFYLKTCAFRQAKPIEENMFCSKPPVVLHTLAPCHKSNCSCCHPRHRRIFPEQRDAVQFNVKQRFQFVNGYQTILNGPATCETAHIIYALTCPCEQSDFVGTTSMSFRDCLTKHRHESNRIIREFLLGPAATHRILQNTKSEEARRHDRMWLYQHTARCPVALQLFLDANPHYWCLVPMSEEERRLRANTTTPLSHRRRPTESRELRHEADAKYLVTRLPDPPESYAFTDRQRHAQVRFFQQMQDQLTFPELDTSVDLYNASIVALLPENSSEMLRQLLLSLFITHADCELNQSGRLVNKITHRDYPVRGNWCANLVRPPLSSLP